MKPVIAVTMGDPAGIGPEVIVRALSVPSLYRICSPIVFASPDVLSEAASVCGISIPIVDADRPSQKRASPGPVIRVVSASKIGRNEISPGRPTARTGRAAFECIEAAVQTVLAGGASAITTAPLSKAALAAAGIPYPGHTEMLGSLSGVPEVGMLMVGRPPASGKHAPELRILLATRHTSLSSVPSLLTPERIVSAIRLAHGAGRKLYSLEHPRIAVTALNPHAGEGGLFGQEEATVILPALREAERLGLKAAGPFPADTLFPAAAEGRFDIVIAMYHDQAMIPVKLLSFGRAVNITVGLPFIRTSVDHGTAYDIAWMGKADPGSLLEALRMAVRLVGNSSRASDAK